MCVLYIFLFCFMMSLSGEIVLIYDVIYNIFCYDNTNKEHLTLKWIMYSGVLAGGGRRGVVQFGTPVFGSFITISCLFITCKKILWIFFLVFNIYKLYDFIHLVRKFRMHKLLKFFFFSRVIYVYRQFLWYIRCLYIFFVGYTQLFPLHFNRIIL